VAKKELLKVFEAQPVIATRLCSEGQLNDFKESERYRLTDVRDLSLETRRPVEVVRVLRAAVVSSSAGLETIGRCDVEWGYLEPLIDLIRYECLRETGQAEEAARLREAHEEDYGKLTFDLIDRGDGLIARLRRLEGRGGPPEEPPGAEPEPPAPGLTPDDEPAAPGG